MAEGEKIDIVKAVTSPFTGLYWVKTIMYGLGLAALLFIALGIKKAYFSKPQPTQAITVQPGGNVTIKNEAAKRHLILFTEPWIGVETREDKASIGIRGGCRWEF